MKGDGLYEKRGGKCVVEENKISGVYSRKFSLKGLEEHIPFGNGGQ